MAPARPQVSLASSYHHCARVAREQARNFYYAFRVLPGGKRHAFCAIYAFMRHSDDISDAGSDRLTRLAEWRGRLERALAGDYGNSAVLPAFHDTLRRFSIPAELFFELLRGAEMDLTGARYRTFHDLYRYCYRVAGVVGLTSIRIFGFPQEREEQASRLAESCGIAFQLTNILRDLKEDAEAGRTYLPEEDLERFGCSASELALSRVGDELRDLILYECQRAWEYYRQALPLLELVSADSRPALWAMIALYASILKRIELAPLAILRRRVELSDMEKFQILTRGLWSRVTGAALPAPF
jgi:phytoene synthase